MGYLSRASRESQQLFSGVETGKETGASNHVERDGFARRNPRAISRRACNKYQKSGR